MRPLIRCTSGLLFLMVLIAAARGQGNVNASGGFLLTGGGLEVPEGSVVLLVAATGSGGFGAVQAGSSLAVGSYINGNDLIIGASTTLNLDGTNSGSFSISTASTPAGSAGEQVELVWFTTGSTTATVGSQYGTFTTTAFAGTSASWTIPSSNGLNEIDFTTTTDNGSYDPSVARADETVLSAVPEPADWGLIAGLAALGFAAVRRRTLKAVPAAP